MYMHVCASVSREGMLIDVIKVKEGEGAFYLLTWIYGNVRHSSEFWVHGDHLVVHVLAEVLSDRVSELSDAL